MYDVEQVRKDFPMLQGKTNESKPLVYLDNGATTFKPQAVINAVSDYYTNITANAHRGDYELSMKVDNAFEAARETISKFINCESREVVFTNGASAALNLAAYGYGYKFINEGDVILSTLSEHASSILPWFRVAKEKKASVQFIEFDKTGHITMENVKKAINDKVKVIVIAAISNVLGNVVPIKEICAYAHSHGIVVFVDGAQSVPHVKTDVKDLDCDFLAFSGHKMCAPTGIGVLYGKYELLEKMDAYILGGGSNARFDKEGNLLLKNAPYKFEAGTPPIEGALGLKAAIDYLEHLGMDNIHRHEVELKDYLQKQISQLDNIIVYNPNADSGILTFNVKGVFAQDASSYLSSQGICLRAGNHCAKLLVNYLGVDATLRCSIYLYNTKQDIDRFVEALKTTTIENCIGVIF